MTTTLTRDHFGTRGSTTQQKKKKKKKRVVVCCCCCARIDDEEDRGRRGASLMSAISCRRARILDAVDERANMAGNSGRAGMVWRPVVRDIDHVRDAGADVVRNEQQEYHEISVRVDCTAGVIGDIILDVHAYGEAHSVRTKCGR